MDLLGGLSGTPRHRILTGRIRARTRDRQMIIWPTPHGRESASVKECDGRLGTPYKTPGDLFSSFGIPSPPLCVQARPAESSGCGRGRRACGRAAQPPSRPPAHLRIPRLRRLAARAYHAPAPAADSRSDFGVAFPRATGRDLSGEEGMHVRCVKSDKWQSGVLSKVKYDPTPPEGQYRLAALDISAGGDEQVLAVCDGNRAWIEWTGFERDDHRLVDLVIARLHRACVDPDDCLSDDGGLGKIVNNQFDREGYALRRFDFNGTPQDPTLYENSRAEAYFKLADLVRLGRVSLPDDDVLREELAFCRYDVESSPLKLVPKKKLPRSPNRSDALAMLFWELDYAKLTAKPEDTSDLTSPTRRRREREEFAGSTWEE